MVATPTLVRLSPALIGPAAEALALAFHDDPINRHLLPNAAQRAHVLHWMFHVHLRYGLRYGEVYTTADVSGVAIWLSPGQTTPTLWRLLRSGALSAPLQLGWDAFKRSLAFKAFSTTWHTQYAPEAHWYLFYLGVPPTQQGQGIGSALLQPMLARADADQLPCYLVTSARRNLGFYQRHGFVSVAEGVLPHGGPHLWAMRREPRGASSLTSPVF